MHYTFYKITIFASAPSGPPQNIRHKVLSYSSVRLFWSPLPLHQQNGNITGYSVQVLTTDGTTNFTHKAVTEDTTVQDLKEATSYIFQVSAMTSVGKGPYKAHGPVTTAIGELDIVYKYWLCVW